MRIPKYLITLALCVVVLLILIVPYLPIAWSELGGLWQALKRDVWDHSK